MTTVFFSLVVPALGLTLLRAPPTPVASRWRAPRCNEADPIATSVDEIDLVPDSTLRKAVLWPGDEERGTPKWGAVVEIQFTGRFTNGTVFDKSHAVKPFEFQLNAGDVVEGMERGVKSMRVGEQARLTCESKWAYAAAGVGSRIPPNATLVYDVELLSWKEGPPVENQDLDMAVYRSALEGKQAGSGRTSSYRWSEGGEEVTLWLPLREGEGAKDVALCEFRPKKLSVRVGGGGAAGDGASAAAAALEVSGDLKGRCVPEESYWVIDEESDGTRALQVVLAKAGVYTRWDGVLIDEDELAE